LFHTERTIIDLVLPF